MTLLKIKYSTFLAEPSEEKYKLLLDLEVKRYIHDETTGAFYLLTGIFKAGSVWDGNSTPWAFRWVIPKWSETNELINVLSLLHDGDFSTSGWGFLDYSSTNDLLRGGWREAGYSRVRASSAEFFVQQCARSHWGSDENNLSKSYSTNIKRVYNLSKESLAN